MSAKWRPWRRRRRRKRPKTHREKKEDELRRAKQIFDTIRSFGDAVLVREIKQNLICVHFQRFSTGSRPQSGG